MRITGGIVYIYSTRFYYRGVYSVTYLEAYKVTNWSPLPQIHGKLPLPFQGTSWVGLELELQYTASTIVNSQRELKQFRVLVLIFSVDSESVLEFLFKG